MGSVSDTMTLHDRLKQDLATALAARDLETARVLRTLVAAIDNAAAVAPGPALGTVGAADVPRRRVSDDEAMSIVRSEADELAAAIATYETHDRTRCRGRAALATRRGRPVPGGTLSVVRSVLGDVPAAELGVTAAHEHLIIDSPVVVATFPQIHLPSVKDAVAELEPWRAAGLGAVVDAMPVAQGGDADRLALISRRTGLHVVAATGRHTAKYDVGTVPDDLSALADRFLADLTRREHPCGVIKVSTGPDGVDRRARLVFGAAALASAETGAPILTHCENGKGGIEQLGLLTDLGVDLGRVALSHTDKVDDPGYHRELLANGVNLVYDQCLRRPAVTAGLLVAMLADGHAGRLMLGTDGARRSMWSSLGGHPGLASLLTDFVPSLRGTGVEPATITALLVDNPARWLAWRT